MARLNHIDAIIVGDDAAFNFAVDNKDTLFKDIPIFFEGVNNGDKAVKVSASSQITGVVESLSYKNTIKAASKIIPNAKKIVAILDDTVTGMGERIQYYKYKNIYPQYEFDEINASKLSQHDLIEKVKSLDSDTILIYIMCSSDKDGNTYIDSQGIKLVSENAPVPTFSIVSIGMEKALSVVRWYLRRRWQKLRRQWYSSILMVQMFQVLKYRQNRRE